VFTTRMTVSLPSGFESTRVAHGSVPPPEVELLLLTAAVVGDATISVEEVGRGSGVFVGRAVGAGVSVGGRGVAVGMAAWVCATMVCAAATAVFCTSTACMVGAAGLLHALMSIAMTATMRMEKRFMFFEYLLMNLAIGITTTERSDAVILDDDLPIAFRDVETTECFEILFAGDECTGTVLSDGTGEAIAADDQIATLAHASHYIHG